MIHRLQSELEEARRQAQEEMQAEVEKVKKEALEEQRADFEDKLAEYEKLLVNIFYLIVVERHYFQTLDLYENFLYYDRCRSKNTTVVILLKGPTH